MLAAHLPTKKECLENFLFGTTHMESQTFPPLKQLLIITWLPTTVMTGVETSPFTPQKAILNLSKTQVVYIMSTQ